MSMGYPRIEELQLIALVAFSDACTIPLLTPTCPYYRQEPDGPRCGEECRAVLSSRGVDRSSREVTVLGGLIMQGTPMPIEVASGYAPFDATRQLLEERGKPIAHCSTGTLLLKLRSHAAEAPESRSHPDSFFFELWQELAHRGIPVEKVIRAAVAPAMAAAIVRIVKSPLAYDLPEWQIAFKSGSAMGLRTSDAYGRWFADQVAEWFARLVDHDSNDLLAWKAPPATLLLNMPSPPPIEDEGQWLWDRFTRSSFDEWYAHSLLMEWRYARCADSYGLDPRVMNVRSFDTAAVAEAFMDRISSKGLGVSYEVPRDLSPMHFVHRASEFLRTGHPEKAAEIFAALVVVHPADGDALNNLGFCLLPTDAAAAQDVLDRASTFPSRQRAVNMVNRAFASHVRGRDAEALSLLEQAKLLAHTHDWRTLMWVEDECKELTLKDVESLDDYIVNLREHIIANSAKGLTSPANA